LELVSEVTDVKPEAIVQAVSLLMEHQPGLIIYGSGVTHYPTARDV